MPIGRFVAYSMSRLTIVQIVLKMLNLFLLQNKGTVRRIEAGSTRKRNFRALTCRTILISGILQTLLCCTLFNTIIRCNNCNRCRI